MSSKKKQKQKIVKPQFYESKYFSLISISIISLLGLLIYSNIFKNAYHYDDIVWISHPAFSDLSNIKDLFNFNPFRFVTFITLAINRWAGGYEPFGFYFVNIVIHIINSLLVWQLIKLILKNPSLDETGIIKYRNILALLGALIFLTHPLQTQAVTYVYQRLASLAATFYLASFIFYVRARLVKHNRRLRSLLFVLSITFFVIGMFTKENTFTLPIMIFFYELVFFKKEDGAKPQYLLLAFMLFIIGGALAIAVVGPHRIFLTQKSFTGEIITSGSYLLTSFRVIITYIRLLILPLNQSLSYEFPISRSFFELPVIISLLLILLVLGFAFFMIKRNKLISFGIFWFFVALVVESSVIPIIDVIMEHRLYLPMFGFSLFIIGIVYQFFWKKYSTVIIICLFLLTGIYSIMTFERNKVWKTEYSLWNDAVQKAPNKARPYNGRGMALMDYKEYKRAIRDFTKAIQITPSFEFPYKNRGNAYFELGQYHESLKDYRKYMSLDTADVAIFNNLGNVYLKLKEYDSSIVYYSKYLNKNPEFFNGYFNRATSYYEKNDYLKAFQDLNNAFKLKPNDYSTILLLAKSCVKIKSNRKAIELFSRIISQMPKSVDAYYGRAEAYFQMRDYENAVTDFEKVISLKPGYQNAEAQKELALQLKMSILR